MPVLVLGMHRSGTSVVTRLLNLAGLPLPPDPELARGGPANPRGFWEIPRLTEVNEAVLRALDGEWSAPPPLPSGWQRDPRLDPVRRRARRAYRSALPPGPALWKDPRLCLTMPFWRDLAGEPDAVVIVTRNPTDVIRSLEARNGLSPSVSLALWEVYLRAALSNLHGAPAAVAPYEEVMADPPAWVDEARAWLVGSGVACDTPAAAAEIGSFVDEGLRHGRSGSGLGAIAEASDAQREVEALLGSLAGFHSALDPPTLPALTTWAQPVLEERRTARGVRRRRAARRSTRARRFLRRRAVWRFHALSDRVRSRGRPPSA